MQRSVCVYRLIIRCSHSHVRPLQAYVIEQRHVKHDMGKLTKLVLNLEVRCWHKSIKLPLSSNQKVNLAL